MSRQPRRRVLPALEALEDRSLPSASPLADAVVRVEDVLRAEQGALATLVRQAEIQVSGISLTYQGGLLLNQNPYVANIHTDTSYGQVQTDQALFAMEPYSELLAPYYQGCGAYRFVASATGPAVGGKAVLSDKGDIVPYLQLWYDAGAYNVPGPGGHYAADLRGNGNEILELHLQKGQTVGDMGGTGILGYHSSFWDARYSCWVFYCVCYTTDDVTVNDQVTGHETEEAITDPQVGQYSTLGLGGLGFVDLTHNPAIELMDELEWQYPVLSPQGIVLPRECTPDGTLIDYPGQGGPPQSPPGGPPQQQPPGLPPSPPGGQPHGFPPTPQQFWSDAERLVKDAFFVRLSPSWAGLAAVAGDLELVAEDEFAVALAGWGR